MTRPDIGLALSTAMSWVAQPNENIYIALLCILFFLKKTRKRGIEYSAERDKKLRFHVCSQTKESVDPWSTFAVFYMADTSLGIRHQQSMLGFAFGGVFVQKNSKSKNISLSTTEAEFKGQLMSGTSAMTFIPILEFLGQTDFMPIILMCDNDPACCLSNSDLSSRKLRHVAIQLAYLQDLVSAGYVKMMWVSNRGMVADLNTKMLAVKEFFLRADYVVC